MRDQHPSAVDLPVRHFRRRQADAMRPGDHLGDLAGIEVGPAHRQPARAAVAQRRRGDGPFVDPVGGRIGVGRHVAVHDRHARHGHRRPERVGARIHAHLPAGVGPLPLEMDPVEIEVGARDRRVVADMVGLARVDRPDIGQRAGKDPEGAGHPGHALVLEPRDHRRERVGIEHRIARAGEHQIALDHPVDHRAGGDELGAVAEIVAQRLERVERGDDLGHRSRRQREIGVAGFEQMAGAAVDHDEADLAAETGLGQQVFDDRGAERGGRARFRGRTHRLERGLTNGDPGEGGNGASQKYASRNAPKHGR